MRPKAFYAARRVERSDLRGLSEGGALRHRECLAAKSRIRPSAADAATEVAQTGSLLYRGLVIRWGWPGLKKDMELTRRRRGRKASQSMDGIGFLRVSRRALRLCVDSLFC